MSWILLAAIAPVLQAVLPPIRGVILQQQQTAGGLFLQPAATGYVELNAR